MSGNETLVMTTFFLLRKLNEAGNRSPRTLPGAAFYIGALGSRKTQAKRRERMRAAGLTEAQLEKLHGPIGLNIGATTPDEIALSIMAEVVAARNNQLTTTKE